jgi:hypothetical protein
MLRKKPSNTMPRAPRIISTVAGMATKKPGDATSTMKRITPTIMNISPICHSHSIG